MTAASRPRRVVRHGLAVRITHWLNAVILAVLLMSGLQIFNAHPALYWGEASDFDRPWLALTAEQNDSGAGHGYLAVLGRRVETTGLLGASDDGTGELEPRGFPRWATLPSYLDLAGGRLWHFFFAWALVLNGLVYVGHGLWSGHFRRDLLPGRGELRQLGRVAWDHLRLRFAHGDAAHRYNPIQKLAYLVVLGILLLIVLAGLAMSPRLDAGFPALPALFGGRQSARSIHFLAATGLVAFVLVHLAMVAAAGPWTLLRGMITGGDPAPDASD